jgi:glutamate/tyrosine decarboxylase-like PLP-dependent enzyme
MARDPVDRGDDSGARHATEPDVRRVAPLAMDAALFREAGHRLVDRLAELMESIPRRPVTPGETPAAVRAALGLGQPLPEQGEDPTQLLERAAGLLFEHSLFNAHPRFFGYITSSPAPIGVLGDLLASAINPNVGAWILSPAATEIESETVRWIAQLIGYPTNCGGLLVSGGNVANLVCFLAARAAMTEGDVRVEGLTSATRKRPRIYASAETHTWLQKAADIAGLGTASIRWIPTDHAQRMDVDGLAARISADRAAGDLPLMVIGTAGTVSTGAVDPLPRIAALCREQRLWFHVDGAYGAFAAAVPGAPDDLRGMKEADSVAVDPHKWLYAPLEAGCAMVRDPERLRAAFTYHPPYYRFDEHLNYVDYGQQNSRGFRALKVWLALRHAGTAGYRRMISDDIRLAAHLADAVMRHPELELFTRDLSIATFRFVPVDLRPRVGDEAVERHLDALNRELLDRLQSGGEAFVSNAVVGGRYLLRACIVNFHTDVPDVEALPVIVARVGRSVDRELRPAAG